MISIVIPTFNEERYLPALLDSIKRQDVSCEVIVADNHSKDRTRAIAKRYKCRIVDGGRFAAGLNAGARQAKGDILFLCADIVLPEGFLARFLKKIREADMATCLVWSTTKRLDHALFYGLKNFGNFFFRWPIVHVSSQCLFVKKSLYAKAGGFDEELFLGEEHEFATRAAKHGRFTFFLDMHVLNHPRRLEKEGTFRMIARQIYSELYRFIRPRMKKKIYEYEYGKF